MGGKRVTKKQSATKAVSASTQSFFGQPIVMLIVVVAMAIGAFYLLLKGPVNFEKPTTQQVPTAQDLSNDLETEQDKLEETTNIIDRIASHILINKDETPFIATITNIDLVRQKNPVFYKDASEGDKVLIWSDKAVIYSPRLDKLVAVVTALNPTITGEAGEVVMEDVSIEIRNGSRVAGAASRLRSKLIDEEFNVTRIGDARGVYEGMMVIDQTNGEAPNALAKILELTEGTPQSLPENEPASEADIVIIIGL